MEELRYVPKYIQIKKNLERQIKQGIYSPGDRIPTEFELTKMYGVSRITVTNAIKELVNEGLLVRAGPKGTFVSEIEQKIKSESIAGLLLPARGHLFGEFSRHLVQNLHAADYYSFVCDTSLLARHFREEKKKIQRFLSAEFGTLIVDGVSIFPFDLLLQKKDIDRLIFIFRFETSLLFPQAIKVLSDYDEGGYLAVKHLLELGHRKILVWTYEPQPEPYFYIHSLLAGCRRAFRESRLDPGESFSLETYDPERSNEEKLTKILSGPDRPTAIFAFGDVRCGEIFSVARKLNLSIPEDLAIVGYYNTPWCEKFDVPLTSISVEEESMVKVVRYILEDKMDFAAGETILIKPKIAVRSSCGADKSRKK